MTRGPVITTLAAASAISSLLALMAIGFSIVTFSDRLNTIQAARVASATDTCQILDFIILRSSAAQHKLKQGRTFIHMIGLDDCHKYGLSIRKVHHLSLPEPPLGARP
jgi:hypothetical protein